MADDRYPRPVLRTRLYEQVAEQITGWIAENGLGVGDRLPPERELAVRLGVSRATLSQALVALEVIGVVVVRHGDGTVLTDRARTGAVIDAIRAHADRLPEIIEARDALESKLAALAAVRRTDADLAAIRAALEEMERDIAAGGRGVEGDELFHGAVTRAARSELLAQMMAALESLIKETRLESLSQPGRPSESLAGHRRIAEAIAASDPGAAAQAMHAHVMLISDVALLREQDALPERDAPASSRERDAAVSSHERDAAASPSERDAAAASRERDAAASPRVQS